MQKIGRVTATITLAGAFALVTGCSSAPPAVTPDVVRSASPAPAPAAPSPSVADQPVVASMAQSALAGAAAVMNILHRGGRPSAETCATQWNELSKEKQASLDRVGFDAGCYGSSTPDVVTFGPGSGPSPSGTP
ncbi:hypothetical protein [Streptomyces sp. CB03911]|uniref:hypothetical protein n=1 Tax=Streptomyces sp. CB03911 TaxID=1804758 RepID=UPI00093B24C8|nr:hypothetical protein [Streptomyces sp. CB03911]OKI29159.1 hypothetical protein A6A07_23500 [Streptomyces sp. CB03911]